MTHRLTKPLGWFCSCRYAPPSLSTAMQRDLPPSAKLRYKKIRAIAGHVTFVTHEIGAS